ncbi:MAG: hypothetical protein AB1671_16215, partial [Thermodesulfobacteriota bacterium]
RRFVAIPCVKEEAVRAGSQYRGHLLAFHITFLRRTLQLIARRPTVSFGSRQNRHRAALRRSAMLARA